jgi:hypothetical protein
MNAQLAPPIWTARLRLALELAGASTEGIPIDDLTDLLPDDGPRSEAEIEAWISRNLPSATVVNGRAYPPTSIPGTPPAEPGALAGQYLRRAQEFFGPWLSGRRREVRCAAVTGSVAYGSADRSDDIDLLVCTSRGAVWAFLAQAYLRVRLRRHNALPGDPPRWCFNFVADDRTLTMEYRHARGLLYAREALNAHVLLGESFYRGVVGACPWMGTETPRLYRRWEASGFPPPPETEAAPWPVRVANLLFFLLLAPYLQLLGLWRNQRLRREGRVFQEFRTVTLPGRLFYQSRLFDDLARRYREVSLTEGR